jgi:hypothetical protein
MEIKFITDKLIKVANALDEMGLNKEANSLDKIARKIVVSANPFMNNRNYVKFKSTGGPEKMSQRTGIYANDIENYKRLYIAANYDDDGKKDIDKELLQSASNLYNSVVNAWFNNPYSDLQKKKFKLQAERIRSDIDSRIIDINEEVNKGRKFSLNEYLVKAKITDYDGKLLSSIKDKQTLRKLWLNKLPEYFPQYFDNSNTNPRVRKQFTNTFNMLAMGLPEVLPAVESKDV